MGKGIKITDTTLRDAHQSLWATRMRTEDMLPIARQLDAVGYHSLEVWGGATFDVAMRYLGEDPWERLRLLRQNIRNTKLQMLLRGQNVVGYKHYPDDVLERFVIKAKENGIDIFRIFDALNDVRNMEAAMRTARETGAHVQASVVYTVSPVHTLDHFVATAKTLAGMGADSICIKDMAGLLTPYFAYELVGRIKETTQLPVQLHDHYVGGLSVMTYLKAIEAGVDAVDCCSVPLAFGTSQPPVEALAIALKDTPYDPGFDLELLFEIAEYFDRMRKENGHERAVTRIADMQVHQHQVPGGMISNLVSQLEQQKAASRLGEVLAEIPRVRAELGYPPMVTPTSQIVGTQAVFNVITGERYKVIPGEVKEYIRGCYGLPPQPVDPAVRKLAIGDEAVIDCRPADLLKPGLGQIPEAVRELAKSEEDILSYALFPEVARKFFADRKAGGAPVAAAREERVPATAKEGETVNLKEIRDLIKMVDETEITELNLESENLKISVRKGYASGTEKAAAEKAAETAPKPAEKENVLTVTAPMVGVFYRAPSPDAEPYVKTGDVVNKGQALCIIEAMKLMNEITTEVKGKIAEILVENGKPVEFGQPLFRVEVLQ
ncbi:MAG: acetyl-CoA carboxylase biotin carboxyl carrier protein [bacterium]|jgi:oxaloacetate decarboxylase alpha subunit